MLSPQIILIAIISYFVVLTAISYFTGKEDNLNIGKGGLMNSLFLLQFSI